MDRYSRPFDEGEFLQICHEEALKRLNQLNSMQEAWEALFGEDASRREYFLKGLSASLWTSIVEILRFDYSQFTRDESRQVVATIAAYLLMYTQDIARQLLDQLGAGFN